MLFFYQVFNVLLFCVITALFYFGAASASDAAKAEILGPEKKFPHLGVAIASTFMSIICYLITTVLAAAVCCVATFIRF